MFNVTTMGELMRTEHVEPTDVCQEFSTLNSDSAIYITGQIFPRTKLAAINITMGSAILKSCLNCINVLNKEGELQESGTITLVIPSSKYLYYHTLPSETLFFEALTGLNYSMFEEYFTVIISRITSVEKVRVMT